jgi:alkylhydroperoxidase family enzyme
MPRIEPIPFEELPDEARQRIEAGMATGMYTIPVPMQIVAHSPLVLRAMDEGYKAHFRDGVLGQRLQELLRIRSAQLNSCQPCSLSRKDDSISEDDVACLADLDERQYTRPELLALRFLDQFAQDHHSIDDDTFRDLAEEFSLEQIIELGWLCAQFVGGHRFMHTLDALGSGEPVLRTAGDRPKDPARS